MTWLNYGLLIAIIVISFVCGLQIGRLQKEDEMRRPATPLDDMLRGDR